MMPTRPAHDDELDRMLRAARPVHIPDDGSLPPDAEAHLQRLLARSPTAAQTPPLPLHPTARVTTHRWWTAAAAAAVVAALAMTVSVLSLTPRPSYAATPPVPQYGHVTGAAAPLLEGLAARTRRQPDTSASAPVRYEAWSLSTDINADDAAGSYIQPQDTTVIPAGADVTVTVRAGRPYDGTGAAVTTGGNQPGALVSEYTTTPITAPPTTVAEWPAYLTNTLGLDPNPPAGEVLLQLSSILHFWTLTPAQNGALLDYLATLPDLHVAGSSTDRLGRTGIAFDTETVRDDWQPTLLIDAETGRILAEQTLYVGTDRTDIASPSVIDYTLWK